MRPLKKLSIAEVSPRRGSIAAALVHVLIPYRVETARRLRECVLACFLICFSRDVMEVG
jgi:hypothetical protein